jgi:hypothetical protein
MNQPETITGYQTTLHLPPKKLTHNQRLLNALLSGQEVTPLDSWRNLGIYRLASHIHELRHGKYDGVHYRILDDWHHANNQWGEKVVVKKYFFNPQDINYYAARRRHTT